jgi:hypothetical protein
MMKKVLLIFIASLLSCEVDENTPTTPLVDNFDETSATLIKQGTFTGIGGHTASGKASVYESNGQKVVVLDPYSSQNGPDLKVYLSKNVGATSYINLGQLKSTTGKQTYAIPGSVTLSEYTHVHIWCEAYSVEFARAPLQ